MKNKIEGIKFSEFWFQLIVPFSYNKGRFSLLGQEEHKETSYKEVTVDQNVFNSYGNRVFVKTDKKEPMVKGFEITSNNFRERQLGIRNNPKYKYLFHFSDKDESDVCNINIAGLRLYFHASGNGFLTIEVLASDIDALHILDLKAGLTYMPDIVARKNGYSRISCKLKRLNDETGKYEDTESSFTIKELVGRFFDGITAKENTDAAGLDVKPLDVKYCYAMAGGLMPETAEEGALSLFMEAFCLQWTSKKLVDMGKNASESHLLSKYDGYYEHICWKTSLDTMLFIGDMQKAESEKSQNILTDFRKRNIWTYLLLYLYYLNIYLELNHKKGICQDMEEHPKLAQEYNIDELIQSIKNFPIEMEKLCEEQEHQHINILFQKHLCEDIFKVSSTLRILTEKYLPMISSKKNHKIFISYRRDRGAYLALLICKLLSQMGKDVFLDLESLQSGAFDEQLFGKINECANVIAIISDGSMERCIESEGDWVKKELAYALEKKKNIIPIFMEGVEGFPEVLPEEIEQIRNMQGIKIDIRYFDAVMDQLLSYLR